jgi:hypothetical protein
MFRRVRGSDLIGIKISIPRSTVLPPQPEINSEHNLDSAAELVSDPVPESSVDSQVVGVVREYCRGLGEYFLTFDDLTFPPLWMNLHPPSEDQSWLEGVSLVVDWDQESSDRSEPHPPPGDGDGGDGDQEEGSHLKELESETLVPKANGVNGKHLNDVTQPKDEVASSVENGGPHPEREEVAVITRRCDLCHQADELVQSCPKCKSHSYHPLCMPLEKLGINLTSADSWRCWHCICESSLSPSLPLITPFLFG